MYTHTPNYNILDFEPMTTYYARSNLVIFGPKKKSLKIAVKPWDFYEKFRGTNICIFIPQTTIY